MITRRHSTTTNEIFAPFSLRQQIGSAPGSASSEQVDPASIDLKLSAMENTPGRVMILGLLLKLSMEEKKGEEKK